MLKGAAFKKLAHKMRVPAGIVHIAFPLLCWALVALRWCGIWFAEPWMAGVTAFYYALAAAYLFYAFMARMRIVGIIGLFFVFASCLFVWIPHNWVLAVLLISVVFKVTYDRKDMPTTIAFTIAAGIITLVFVFFGLVLNHAIPEKYAYYPSPDGQYAALEYAFTTMPGGTDVILCRGNGTFMVKERVLYLANYSDFGSEIEWLNESTIIIYGEKMDVFNDTVIERYNYF